MSIEHDHSVHSFSGKIKEASSFREWLTWFTGLLLLSTLIGCVWYVGSSNLATYIIYMTMGVLIGIAFYASFRDVRSLHREIHAASRQMRELIETDDIESFLNDTEKKRDLSYFRSHIASLYKIYTYSSEIYQDTLIEILNSKLLARNRKVELFSSILITLGLIGTIVGLIFMMTDLTNLFDNAEQGIPQVSELLQSGGPLKGLGTAFFTTLIGALFGGVILRILTSIVEEGITKYVALLAELTEVNVLPVLRAHSANQ